MRQRKRPERMKGDHSLLRSERFAKVYTKMAGIETLGLKVSFERQKRRTCKDIRQYYEQLADHRWVSKRVDDGPVLRIAKNV